MNLTGRYQGPQQERLLLGLPAAVLAALELGGYNTTGTLCQTAGLAMTSATRGAFLAQASALFTPLLAACLGMPPSRALWLSCLLGLAGTLVIAADPGAHAALGRWPALPGGTARTAGLAGAAPAPRPLGDALIVAAAACYSAATVRIPVWAVQRRVPPLQLALGKSAVLAAASCAALGLAAARGASRGQPLAALWPGWRQPQGWGLILWSALGPGALSTFLHIKGQSLVSPAAAQVAFASVPLWSALLAAVALPGEAVSRGTWLGGALIAAAGLVAALAQRRGAGGAPSASSSTPG
ncbi:hypothetical protein ABPG77_001949 [Micractinium sp. CCAP 211/92]